MRLFRFVLCVLCLSAGGLRAADEQEEKQQPDEIPDFNQLDEYIYVPRSTLSLGSRFFLKGPKTTYSGQGSIPSQFDPGSSTVANVSHTYFDGNVQPDARTLNGVVGVGESQASPIPSDGKTNTWGYDNASQYTANGDMTFHTYSAEVTDPTSHESSGTPNSGLELIMDRDMGKIGKHLKWSLTAGFSISDIRSGTYAMVPGTLTTTTDTYDLFGQVPPAAPYSSPNTTTQNVVNSSGQVIAGAGTTAVTQTADQTILLGNVPISRTVTTSNVTLQNRYWMDGAYYTLRFGPTLIVPFTNHLELAVSAGPAILYAGDTMNVLESFDFGDGNTAITQTYQKENSKIMPGYYIDVDLRYDLTDTAGFYLGGVYEGAGSFGQSVSSGAGTSYDTKVDFGSQDGVKAGLTLRF